MESRYSLSNPRNLIILPGLVAAAGADEGEFGDDDLAGGSSDLAGECDGEECGLAPPASQPGSSGNISHAIVNIATE